MKKMSIVIFVLLAVPVLAQTYTDTEFIVEGQPSAQQPGTTTVTTTCPSGTTVVTSTVPYPPPPESPIYVGMTKYHLTEVMGRPTYVEKFRRFAARKQGIYDEVWTYQTPTGVTYVYIKERRVARIEYR